MAYSSRDELAKDIIKKGKERGKSEEEIKTVLTKALADWDSQQVPATKDAAPTASQAQKNRGGNDSSWMDLPGNILPSAGRMVGDIGTAVLNPIDTVKGIGGVVQGGLAKLVPGKQESEAKFDAMTQFFVDRYGSVENAKKTMINDPVGVLSDIASVFTGAGAAVKATGAVGKLSGLAKAADVAGDIGRAGKIARAGDTLIDVGNKLDPITASLRGAGKVVDKVGDSRIGQAIQKPAAGQYNQEAAQLAKELDIKNPPVSSLTSNRVVHLMEAVSQKGWFGKKIAENVDAAFSRLDELREELVQNNLNHTDLNEVGTSVKAGFEKFQDNFSRVKNQLYDAVPKELNDAQAVLDNTLNALDEIIANKSKSAIKNNLKFYTDLREQLTSLPQTYENLKATRSELGAKLKSTDPIVTGDKASVKKLYATLSDDLDATIKNFDEGAFAVIDEANRYYKETINKINSTIGKNISKLNPEQIVNKLIKPNSETDIALIKEIVGDEGVANLQKGFMDELIKKSMTNDVIDIKKLKKNIKTYTEPTLRTIFTPEQYDRLQSMISDLEKIEGYADSLKTGTKPAVGSQTSFLQLSHLDNPIVAIAAFFNPTVLTAYLTQAAGRLTMGNLMGSDFGRQLFTTGIDVTGPAAQQIQNIAPAIGNTGKMLRGEGIMNEQLEALRRAKQASSSAQVRM